MPPLDQAPLTGHSSSETALLATSSVEASSKCMAPVETTTPR